MGAIVAVLLTAVITIWEWIENPGGIYRGEQGTDWRIVYETAISWLAPAFVTIALLAAAGHGLWTLVRKRRVTGS